MSTMQMAQAFAFRPAHRVQTSLLAAVEMRVLRWLAVRTPKCFNSDHLTALSLISMFCAGAAYWWAARNPIGLALVVICLALNWLGDSLDGTLARVRRQERKRYGFYVDHIVDAFSAFFLLGGLALSGYMHERVAIGILVVYLMISIDVYLATYTIGNFKISFAKFSPTELRILLAVGNIFLWFHPQVTILGHHFRLFDVGGVIGIVGMASILLGSAIGNTMRLYRAEPLR